MSLTGLCRATLVLLGALLAGCVGGLDPRGSLPADLPARAAVAGVPLIRQKDFYCGPAALAMALQWSGMDVTQDEIAAQAFSPAARGTYTADMIGSARRRGQLAVELSDLPALLTEVAAGNPVIIFQNLGLSWAPKWHYAVAVGYDIPTERLFLHSGELDRMAMDFTLFDRTWKRGDRWAMLVLPPEKLPAAADQWAVLRAAAALERAGQHGAAETAYQTGAGRWPENWLWYFGLGNARFQRGDLAGARRAFRRALDIDPSIPEVRHNLAEVNAALGA